MYLTDRFDCVQSIELICPSVESRSKIIVAGEVLLLDLKLTRSARPVVHVGSVIHRIADVQSMRWVLRVAFSSMELSLFLIAGVLGIGIHSFTFEFFLYNFASDEFFSSLKIRHSPNYLRISRDCLFPKIKMFRPEIILHPRRPILLTRRIIQRTFSCPRESIIPSSTHRFIYNFNNNNPNTATYRSATNRCNYF